MRSRRVSSNVPHRVVGFTLIELLVVIGIIAILVALLMVAIGKATQSAKRVKAKVQIKQLEKAFVAYHDEYGEWPKGIMIYDNVADPETDWGVKGIEVGSNVVSMLNGNIVSVQANVFNLKEIQFGSFSARQGSDGTTGLLDPWNHGYKYMMDFDDDGKVTSQVTDNDGTISAPSQLVIVWSRGPDGSDRISDGGYKDDITSWKTQ